MLHDPAPLRPAAVAPPAALADAAPPTGEGMRAHAPGLAALGFSLFPITAGAKIPPITGWPALATADPDEIRRLWTPEFWRACLRPQGVDRAQADLTRAKAIEGARAAPLGETAPFNIGVHTGRPLPTGERLLVVDLDTKGKEATARTPGYAAATAPTRYRALEDALGEKLPKTLTSRTPSRGLHLIFKYRSDLEITSSVGLLPGVDTRAQGGYILAPGSWIEGKGVYAWEPAHGPDDRDIADAPEALLRFCKAGPVRSAAERAAKPPACELDTPANIERARQWLRDDAPEAVAGDRGRQTLKRVAQRLGDFGLSADGALDVLNEEGGWNQTKAFPSFDAGADDADGMTRLVEDLFAYHREKPLGCDAPESVFEAVEVAAGSDTPAAPKRRYITADEAEDLALESSGEYLVKGWLDRGTLSVWFGPPGGGKSAVVLGLALSIAAGVPWAGCATRRGLVVYVALERAKGLRKRVKAARAKMGLPRGLPFVILDFRPDLAAGMRGADEIIAAIREAEAQYGLQCELVIIDTVARAMSAADGDKAHEMAAFTNRGARIQDATGAHLLLIHHPTKGDPKSARGSGALLGAVDTEVSVLNHVIEATKESDNGKPTKLHFGLESVAVGKDKSGEEITAVFANVGAAGVFQLPLSGAEIDQLKAFEKAQETISGDGAAENPPVTKEQWDAAADALFPGRGSAATTRRDLRRGLTEKGFITKGPGIAGSFVKATGATEGDGN